LKTILGPQVSLSRKQESAKSDDLFDIALCYLLVHPQIPATHNAKLVSSEFICMCVFTYVRMYVCMYIYICVCVCVCVYRERERERERFEGEFYLHNRTQTDSEVHLAPRGYVPKAGHAPPAGVDVKNGWSYTSVFSRLFGVCMSNFTFVAAPAASSIRSSLEHALCCSFLLLCKKGPN
jgi:hypothetical protein